jgi:hypothetical protein
MTMVSCYRLSPEHLHPDGLNDWFDAVGWVAESGQNGLGINQTRIVVGDDSTYAACSPVPLYFTDTQAIGQILRPLLH